VASEFTGAIPPAQISKWLDELAPSKADRLVEEGDEDSLRAALELDPRHTAAAAKLGRLLLERDRAQDAEELFDRFSGDFEIDGLAARARLVSENGNGSGPSANLAEAFEAWDEGDHERALESLQDAFASEDDQERRDLIRKVMVAIFTELGADSELARSHRRRLAAALH
jgi:putative thioredoxin